MKHLHEKSPCCRGKIRRFGKRRRQCCVCKKTWRVWKKKHGRKKRRRYSAAILNFLNNKRGPFTHQAAEYGLREETFRSRVRLELEKFISKSPWPAIPDGPLVAIADAIAQTVRRRCGQEIWTVYFIFLRPVQSSKAVIMPPLIRLGAETDKGGWQQALDALPLEIKNRILALICDGSRDLLAYAKKEKWVIQRCHFHIRRAIANYIRTGPASRNRKLGLKIKNLVDIILLDSQESGAWKAIIELSNLLPSIHSRFLICRLRGLIKNHIHFRNYIYHPELRLPNTTNTAESFNSLVRDLQSKARGFSSIDSFKRWLIALCKHRKTMTCNGKKYQPIFFT